MIDPVGFFADLFDRLVKRADEGEAVALLAELLEDPFIG